MASGSYAENSFVFLHDIAVRHPGKIITNGALPANLSHSFAGLFAHLVEMF